MKPNCGPRLSVFGIVISGWGIIMLGLLGIFFRIRSPLLAEDLSIDEDEWKKQGYNYNYIIELYNSASTNALIAAAIYVLLLGFSLFQFYLNMHTRGAALLSASSNSGPNSLSTSGPSPSTSGVRVGIGAANSND